MTNYKQMPLFPELEPDFDLPEIPTTVAKEGDYLFVQFHAGFGGLFRLSPLDIDIALQDWNNPEPDTLMVLPTPLLPSISGVLPDTEQQMLAMTILDKRLVKHIQHVPEEELSQFTERYERDNPIPDTHQETATPTRLLDTD